MKIKNMKVLASLLIMTLSLSACSSIKKYSAKGSPQRIGGAYEPQLEEAILAYKQGRLSSAETLYIQYVNKHPNYTEAWFKLGNIYYRTGQYPAAITAYENVIQQTPKNGKAWHNLALTRVKQAEVTLMRAETIFPIGDPQRRRISALKNKIRGGGLRQKTPPAVIKPSYKVIPKKRGAKRKAKRRIATSNKTKSHTKHRVVNRLNVKRKVRPHRKVLRKK
ncbi:tetratricopeptide repeat protein [Candidatus Gracilibacteria bacterium]|nr:tetratricopeptide repeat protein [Candidatus Gracilibacteria bacterium]